MVDEDKVYKTLSRLEDQMIPKASIFSDKRLSASYVNYKTLRDEKKASQRHQQLYNYRSQQSSLERGKSRIAFKTFLVNPDHSSSHKSKTIFYYPS